MTRVDEILSELTEIARHPARAARNSIAQTGKDAVGCFPYYAPEEIVYAAGLLPIGLWGGQSDIQKADTYLQSFCCSIMRENVEFGLKGAYGFLKAVIIPIYCDTLKCVNENWKSVMPDKPLIPIAYPQNRGLPTAKAFLKSEYERVRNSLSAITGRDITEQDLRSALRLYENYRRTMRRFTELVKDYPRTLNAVTRHLVIKAGYFTDKAWYTRRIKELIKLLKQRPAERFRGSKVIVTGILTEPEALLEAFVQNDIAFVADDLAQESRGFRNSAPQGKTMIGRIAARYLNQQCSLLHDEQKPRGQLLIDLVKQYNADGVVVALLKFCEPEEFDYPIYKKELEAEGIPALYLEIEQKLDSVEQIRTRIQSFAEMLQ